MSTSDLLSVTLNILVIDYRGIVESNLGRGAIELGKARSFGEAGKFGNGIDTSLPSFGSHDGGVGSRRDKSSRRDGYV